MTFANIEGVLQEIGSANHGLATRQQLLGGGLGAKSVDRLVRVGRLIVLYRGLYQIGPVPAARAPEASAVLAGGNASRISHRSAAVIHTLMKPTCTGTPVDLTVPRNRRPRLRGMSIRIHRVRDLRPDEVTLVDGIRVTTVARTLLDLGECIPGRELEQALATALRMGQMAREEVHAMVAQHPKHRGAAPLRRLLAAPGEPAFTRSEAEERLLQLTREGGLPPPELNVRVLGHEVDFFWRKERVVVEVDGYGFHSSHRSFVADRRRDATLTAAGYRTLRITCSYLAASTGTATTGSWPPTLA